MNVMFESSIQFITSFHTWHFQSSVLIFYGDFCTAHEGKEAKSSGGKNAYEQTHECQKKN
jgi:hypothetical protein